MKTRLLTKLAVIVFGAMSAGAVAAPLEIALPAAHSRQVTAGDQTCELHARDGVRG